MKIEGSLDSVMRNIKYYIRVSSEGRNLPYDTLYNTFFNQFMRDEIVQLNIQREELYGSSSESIDLENTLTENSSVSDSKIETLEERNDELELEELLRSLEVEELENRNSDLEIQKENSELNEDFSFKPSTFLDIVKSATEDTNVSEPSSTNSKESIPKENLVHGVFIDEWVKPIKENPINFEEIYKKPDRRRSNTVGQRLIARDEVPNGVFIDEWVKPLDNDRDIMQARREERLRLRQERRRLREEQRKKREEEFNVGKYVPNGVYIDEYVKTEHPKKDIYSDKEVPFSIEDFLSSIEDDDVNTVEDIQVDVNVENNSTDEEFVEFTESIPSSLDEIETKKDEVVVVPTNIRDFIKANQGADVSYVLKYYKKKDIDKAVALGKIYKKFGKLYV